jgi:hypothetical protein
MKTISTYLLLFILSSVIGQSKFDYNQFLKNTKTKPAVVVNRGGVFVLDSTLSYLSLIPGIKSLFSKTDFKYDATGKEIKQRQFQVDLFTGGTTLDLSSVDSTLYDGNGNKSFVYTQRVDPITKQLVKAAKQSLTYNANKLLFVDLYQIWDPQTSAYENATRSTNTYDANKNLIRTINEDYSATWENSSKDTTNYDFSNRPIETISSEWDLSTNSWVNVNRTVNTYNGAGTNPILSDSYDWTGTSWKLVSKVAYTYNSDNNVTLANSSDLDTTTNTFVNTLRILYTYDTNKNLKKFTVRSSDDGITFADLLEVDYFWSELKVGTYILVPTAFKAIFANPMLNQEMVKCSGMTEGATYVANLFDLRGQLIASVNFNGDFELPRVSATGMYLLQITENKIPIQVSKIEIH